jgi:hypothetical protein
MLCRRCRTPETPSGADIARAERNQQIAEQYAAGASLENIARQFHLGVTTVKQALLAQGVTMRPQGRPKRAAKGTERAARARRGPEIDEPAVVAEYLAGDTPPAIAARHGVLPKRIRRILAARGVTLRDDRAGHSGGRVKTLADYDPEVVAEILDRYGRGQSIDKIAAEIDKGTHFVGVVLHKAGIKLRLPANQPTVLDDDARAEMARQYAVGVSAVKIARAFHVSTDRCKAVIREQGVEIRRPGRPSSKAAS